MKNAKNITWIEGEKCCRWKGMHHDVYSKKLGVDGELEIDLPNLIKVGSNIYCNSADDLFQFLQTIPDEEDLYNFVHDDVTIRTFEQMRYDIDLEMLREFTSDLSEYYKEYHAEVRKKVMK